MKLDESAKPELEDISEASHPGEYSEDDLESMLQGYIKAKQIDSDPVLKRMLKDYAMSKNKRIEDLLGANEGSTEEQNKKPSSFSELKKTKERKDKE
jgi:hypothetical protein